MAAKNKFLNAMKMPSIDDMFSSEADRQRESGDLVTEVPLSELHPFVGHPFEVRDDEDMQKLVDSIRENGVLTNLTVRRRAEGGYEIISGHRRFHAAQRAGLTAVKVQVRDIDDDQAIISMVDSNIQREHISPMEKARAYRMKYDALKRQGCRTDLTSPQVAAKLRTDDRVAADAGVSGDTVRRFIRLNSLVPDLQKKVDDGSLKFNPAVELSYLSPTEQNDFLDYIESQSCSPSLSQAQKLKAASKDYIDNDYVFTWEDGHPYSPDYVSHTFHKLLKKYDLPHIRFHDLRHTCASMLLSEGYGLKDVQEWLGHSDIKMTANIYGHLPSRSEGYRSAKATKKAPNPFGFDAPLNSAVPLVCPSGDS